MAKSYALSALLLMLPLHLATAQSGQEPCCPYTEGFAAGRLLVTFAPGTPFTTVQRIAVETRTEVHGQLVDIGDGPIYIMRVPVEQELSYEALFEGLPEVIDASTDPISCIPILPACTCCPIGTVCPSLLPCVALHPVEITLDRSPTDGS